MYLSFILIFAAGSYRLMPHPWNIAPVGALAFMGGIYFGRRYALWVPLAAVVLADIVLTVRMGYSALYWPRLIDYGAFLLIGQLGMWGRGRRPGVKLTGALATPFLFFFLSNFGVWVWGLDLVGQSYAKTPAGLTDCYVAGLPFLCGTLVGDWMFMVLFYTVILLARNTSSATLDKLAAEAKA